MNYIVAKVSNIELSNSLYKIDFDFYSVGLSIVALDLRANIEVGKMVKLAISPSHIAIGKDFSGEISYLNILEATISSIDNGDILSSIELKVFDTTLNAIITAKSSKEMDLTIGNRVKALLKATELAIVEVLDD